MSEVPHENVLVKYLKKYWILIAVSIIFATLHNYCNLLLPKFIQELVDDIIIQGNFDMDTLSNFIERLVIIFVLSGIFDLVRTWITQWVSTNLIYNIRNDMFMALQRQSYSYYDQNRTGDIMSKTTHDVGAIQVFLTNSFQNFFKNIITFIIIFTFVWQSNWQMALLFLALTPPLYILMIWYRKRIRPSSYAMYKAKGGMVSTIQENVTGIRVVKAYGRQENEMEKYLKDNVEFINKSKEVIRLSTIYGPLSEYFTMIGSALLVFLGGYLVVQNLMSLGGVVQSFVYFSMVYDPIRNIVHFFNQLAANRAAMDRVNEVLENRSEIVVYPNPIDPSRVLGDLYIRLLKDEKIIEEIDEYLGILSDKRIDLEEKQRVKKFEEKSILPRGVKLGADENLGFKGNVPILLTDKNILNPIAEKIAGLVNSEKFRIDFKIKTQEKLKKGEEKTVDPILFIMKYLNYLTNNEKLIEETSKRLSKTLNRPINEIKKDPVNSIFEYINFFNKDEYEKNRVVEIQKLLYSPKPKEHTEIAKKYDKLLVKKGIIEPSRKETLLGNQTVTTSALSFLRNERNFINKELKKAENERKRIFGEEEIIDTDEPPRKIEPIRLDTNFEDICWSPVSANFIGHVVFKDVSFAYLGQNESNLKYSLKNINLDVKPGETIAFLGATGSGKSTLINLIPRFYDATEGYIYIDGVDIRELDLKKYRRNIGIVAQESFLFSRSIKDNICYGKTKVKMDDIIAVAKIASIHDFIASLPDGYDTVVGERGQTLSGGQKQRIAIARALLLDPRILILDDSLSAVDVDTEFEIQQALEYLFKDRTTFIITQRLSTIRNCDRIVVLDNGEIVEEGSHEDLINKDGIYTKIYSTMFKRAKQPSEIEDPNKKEKKIQFQRLRRKQKGSILKE